MTSYIVANNAALTELKPSLVDGDVIRLQPVEGGWSLIKIDNTWADNLTFEAFSKGASTPIEGFPSGHPARFTRNVWVHQFHVHATRTVTIRNIRVRLPFWPDNTIDQIWEEVAAAYNSAYVSKCLIYIYGSGAGNLYLDGVEGHQGIGINGTDFDPTKEYKEYTATTNPYWLQSSTGRVSDTFVSGWSELQGHGDTHSVYNTIGNGPSFMHADGGTRTGVLITQHCYSHDVNNAMGGFYGGGFRHFRNWSARPYRDNQAIGVSATLPGIIAETYQCICEDMWSSSYDSANPHSDFDQKYRAQTGSNASEAVVPDIRIRTQQNLLIRRSGLRGSGPQVNFWRSGLDSSWRMVWDNAALWNNVFLTNGTPFGWKTGYIEDPDDVGNIYLHTPGETDNTTIGIDAEAPKSSPRGGGFGRSEGSIMEGTIANPADTLMPFQLITSLVGVGAKGSKVNYATFLKGGDVAHNTTDFGPGTPLTNIWDAYRRQPAYIHLGPPDMSLEEFILGPLTYENIRPFVGWRTALGVEPTTLVTGPICRVRGEPDVDHSFTVTSGEVRVIAKDRTTVLSDWSTSPGTVQAEQFIQPRHTTASSGQARTEIVLEGNSYSFRSQTASLNMYPTIDFDGTTFFQRISGGIAPISPVGSYAVEFEFDSSSPAAIQTLFRAADTTCLSVRVLTTKGLQFILKGHSAAGVSLGEVFQITTSPLTNGHRYRAMIGWDVSKATAAEGVVGRIIDLTTNTTINMPSPSSWLGGDATIRWNQSTSPYTMWGDTGPTNCLDGKGAMMHLQTSQFLDVSDVDIQRRFSPDFIGNDGEGVLLGTVPNVFCTGRASVWSDAAGINRGNGPKFAKQVANAVTDIGSDIWPPVHLVIISTDAPEPHIIDIPITINVDVTGYVPAGTNISITSNTVADFEPSTVEVPSGTEGTFFTYISRKGGSTKITANHSGIYNDATLDITTVDPYTYIAPGTSANLTTTQLSTLQVRTYEDVDITTQTPLNLRWKRSANNTGYTDGINFVVDIDLPAANAFIYKRMVELLTSNVEASLNMIEFSGLIPNENSVAVTIPTTLNNIKISYTE